MHDQGLLATHQGSDPPNSCHPALPPTVIPHGCCQMAKSLLGFPFRPDGPPLAFDFDAPPTKEEQQQGPKRKRAAAEAAEEDREEEGVPAVAPKRPALQGPVGPPFSRYVQGRHRCEGTAGQSRLCNGSQYRQCVLEACGCMWAAPCLWQQH
jgi:hypothetical protein